MTVQCFGPQSNQVSWTIRFENTLTALYFLFFTIVLLSYRVATLIWVTFLVTLATRNLVTLVIATSEWHSQYRYALYLELFQKLVILHCKMNSFHASAKLLHKDTKLNNKIFNHLILVIWILKLKHFLWDIREIISTKLKLNLRLLFIQGCWPY